MPRPADRIAAAAQGLTGLSGRRWCAARSACQCYIASTHDAGVAGDPGRLVGAGRDDAPAAGLASIRVRSESHPIFAGLADFEGFDERYSYLQTDPGVEVLGDHEYERGAASDRVGEGD